LWRVDSHSYSKRRCCCWNISISVHGLVVGLHLCLYPLALTLLSTCNLYASTQPLDFMFVSIISHFLYGQASTGVTDLVQYASMTTSHAMTVAAQNKAYSYT
jgi:hypothetical protein